MKEDFYEILGINKSASESEINRIRPIGKTTESCNVPDLNLDISGRQEEVDDPNDSNGLGAIGERLGSERDCEGLVPTEHKIGTLFQYPEWKTKWVLKKIKVGRCSIMKTKVPVLYTRTTKKVLYSFVLSPKDARRLLERVFLNCMENSALVGGLLLLVTGGNFATAISAFKITMEVCLSTKVPDSIKRCLIPDLGILTEKSGWTPQ